MVYGPLQVGYLVQNAVEDNAETAAAGRGDPNPEGEDAASAVADVAPGETGSVLAAAPPAVPGVSGGVAADLARWFVLAAVADSRDRAAAGAPGDDPASAAVAAANASAGEIAARVKSCCDRNDSSFLLVSRMKMCSSCRRAKYCSKLCQVYDWRSGRHKMECQFL